MISGDWIHSYSPGIWQVYRVIPIAYEMRFSLSDRWKKSRRVVVFSKRLVDDNWRSAFMTESCDQSITSLLSDAEKARLECLLCDDIALKAAFENYPPEPVPLIVNLSMRLPDIGVLESFCNTTLSNAMASASGVTMEETLVFLEKANLARFVGKCPINATLQMVSHDHEMRNGEFVLRDCRVLPF